MKRLVLTGLVLAALLATSLATPLLPAAAQDEFDLPEVLTTPDGSLSINYPTGWAAFEDVYPGVLMLGTSQTVIDVAMSESEPLAGDELAMIVVSPAAIPLFAPEIASAETILEVTGMVMAGSQEGTTYGKVEETEIGERAAVTVPAETPGGAGLLVVLALGDDYGVVSVIGSIEGFDDQEPLVMAMLETLTFTALEGLTAFTTEAGELTLEYPAGWIAFETVPGMVTIANRLADFDSEDVSDAVALNIISAGALIDLQIFEEIGDPTETAEMFFDYWVFNEDVVRLERITLYEDDRAYVDYVKEWLTGYVLAREYEGGLVVIWVLASDDAFDTYAAEVDAIIESIVYTPLGVTLPPDGE